MHKAQALAEDLYGQVSELRETVSELERQLAAARGDGSAESSEAADLMDVKLLLADSQDRLARAHTWAEEMHAELVAVSAELQDVRQQAEHGREQLREALAQANALDTELTSVRMQAKGLEVELREQKRAGEQAEAAVREELTAVRNEQRVTGVRGCARASLNSWNQKA